MKKKTFIGILMVLIFLVSFVSVAAANPFERGSYNIQEFFRGGWRGYDEILLFVLLFILFTAAFMQALGKAFGEMNRQIKVIAVVIALMSALSIVAATEFGLEQMAYIAFGLGALLLLMLIQGMLLKMGVKNKFLAWILALLLALLLLFLLAKLLSEEGIGPFDIDLIKFKKGLSIDFPSVKFEEEEIDLGGEEEIKRKTTTTVPKGTTPTTLPGKETPTEWPSPLWLLLLLIPFLALGGKKLWDRRKGKPPKDKKVKELEEEEKEAEKDINDIISEIKNIFDLKKRVLERIIEIMNRKVKASDDLLDLYHKTIRDPAYYLDKSSLEFRALTGQKHDATELLRWEKELEDELKELMKKEQSLHEKGPLSRLLKYIINEYFGETALEKLPPYEKLDKISVTLKKIIEESKAHQGYREALYKITDLYDRLLGTGRSIGLVQNIKRIIVQYFLISKEEKKAEKIIKKLTDYKKLEYWFKEGKYEKWYYLKDKKIEELKEFFEKEKELLLGAEYPKRIVKGNSLYSMVHQQAVYLIYLLRIIEFLESKRKSFTELQPLKVEPKEAADPSIGVAVGTPIKVFTRIAQGIPPYDCVLYIDGKLINRKQIVSEERFPLIEWSSKEFGELAIGEHTIMITATSHIESKPGLKSVEASPEDTYRRQDRKSIKIYVGVTGGVYGGTYGGVYGVYGLYGKHKPVKGVYGGTYGVYGTYGKVPESAKKGIYGTYGKSSKTTEELEKTAEEMLSIPKGKLKGRVKKNAK